MPELPEVETTRRGLAPLMAGRCIESLTIREARLRWPIAPDVRTKLAGQPVESISRRGKYLIVGVPKGGLLVHLGMSGSLRFLDDDDAPGAHDHVDIRFVGGGLVRYNDPRRFGSMHFASEPLEHPLLKDLGPEPLGDDFTAAYLRQRASGRRAPIKPFIMNAAIVVGVGNIYANEALFGAGIHPARAAGRISSERLDLLVRGIRNVLEAAIEQGGTTLRDFVGGDGRPGYFRQSLAVYERAGEPCIACREKIRRRVIGQRATYYCVRCQR
jgi:formamidopyrimidine-DNA glycosylase